MAYTTIEGITVSNTPASGIGTGVTISNTATGDYSIVIVGTASSASYSVTSSYAETGGTGGAPSVSASYALRATSASYAPGNPSISASYAVSASYAPGGGTQTYQVNTISASFASSSVSSSFATRTISASFAPFTQVYQSNTISSSFASSSVSSSFATLALNVVNGSVSASYAVSASWAPGGGTQTYQTNTISASFASSSVSSSYSILALNVVNGSVSASYAVSASWAPGGSQTYQVNTISASFASRSLSSSFSTFAQTANPVFTGKTNNYVPKWVNNELSAITNIVDTGSFVGIGTFGGLLSANKILHVAGNDPSGSIGTAAVAIRITNTNIDAAGKVSELQFASNNTQPVDSQSFALVSGVVIGAGPSSFSQGDLSLTTRNAGGTWNSGLYIKNTGNVGIGTNNPTHLLTVSGQTIAFGFTGSLRGTASYASEALSASYAPSSPSVSASYALTASYAVNGGGGSSGPTTYTICNLTPHTNNPPLTDYATYGYFASTYAATLFADLVTSSATWIGSNIVSPTNYKLLLVGGTEASTGSCVFGVTITNLNTNLTGSEADITFVDNTVGLSGVTSSVYTLTNLPVIDANHTIAITLKRKGDNGGDTMSDTFDLLYGTLTTTT
jgi:hypothetical protein